jgi:hypothetical protein
MHLGRSRGYGRGSDVSTNVIRFKLSGTIKTHIAYKENYEIKP